MEARYRYPMNLKTLRELKGISRKELADRSGISFRSIQDYEQEHKELRSAKAETILRLAEILDCSMEDLISEVDFSELKPSELQSEELRRSAEKENRTASWRTDGAGAGQETKPWLLMHRDERVAAVQMEEETGTLVSLSHVYDARLLPFGIRRDGRGLRAWWQRRAVPVTQGHMGRTLEHLGLLTPQAFLLQNQGLSMTDTYWMRAEGSDVHWSELSFFQHDFEDSIGAQQFARSDDGLSIPPTGLRFPSASVQGDMPKAWISVEDGKRFLVKGAAPGKTQQIFNEVVAACMHAKQHRFPYVNYQFYTIDVGHGKQLSVSAEAFTGEALEFIPAADIIRAGRQQDSERSDFELFIEICGQQGLSREEVRAFLEYQILTDFVLTNVDRNYGNFGVLRDTDTLRFVRLAPIFDSGSSMFYDLDMRQGTLELNNIRVDSFAPRETDLLRLVTNPGCVELGDLLTREELGQILSGASRTPEEIKLLLTIYERKKDLLFKLQKGDTHWMA
ncbi:MAG TPA: hypothetical protein DIW34_04265 [Oribacterium sp.]|nr:hypothetical protein [Oribacterium sp.]